MTDPAFDEVVHAPQRLRTMALLVAVAGQVEFATIRDVLNVADSVLSKHLKVLRDAGVVGCRKQGLFAYYYRIDGALDDLAAHLCRRETT